MKRFLSIGLSTIILIAGIATLLAPTHVYAVCTEGDTSGCTDGTAAANPSDSSYVGDFQVDPNAGTPEAVAEAAAAQQEIQKSNDKAAQKIADPADAYGSVMQWILKLFAWLVGAAALTLNYAVFYTVVSMGTYVKGLSAIGVTWAILRDIGNIFLIFGFIAVGITTILNVDWYGGGKKMLPMMFVAAIFLNFSLFFAEAIIDMGNLFATQFYVQINGGTASLSTVGTWRDLSNVGNTGIAGKIMNQLGLQTIYSGQATQLARYSGPSAWLVGFMGVILFTVTAFVFFALAFVLIARFVALLFLIMLAPVGFAGLAVPMLSKRAGQWWSTLFEQTVTAPILMLMLYVALKVVTDGRFLAGFGQTTTGASVGFIDNSNLAGFASFLLSFVVAMGLLLAVVIQAKTLGAVGAGAVMKLGQSAAMGSIRFAGRGALGATRFTARNTVGRNLYGLGQVVRTSGFGTTKAGQSIATLLDKGGKGFKDQKEKSVKAQQEYLKSVHGAIEEKHMPAMTQELKDKSAAVDNAKGNVAAAEQKKNEVEASAVPIVAEIQRLEKITSEARNKGTPDLAAAAALRAKQAELESIASERKAAAQGLADARGNLKTTQAAQKEKGPAQKKYEEEKKKASLDYASNIDEGDTSSRFITGGAYGGTLASMKIIKDTLKTMTEAEKALDSFKKIIKEETEISKESTEKSEALNQAKENLTKKTAAEAEKHH